MSIQGDETCLKLLALHAYEQSRQEGSADSVYYANARVLLPDENIYRFEHVRRGGWGGWGGMQEKRREVSLVP